MVEQIEMPFGLWTRVGLRNHVLGWVWTRSLPQEGAHFGRGMPRLSIIRKGAAAARPVATINVATC